MSASKDDFNSKYVYFLAFVSAMGGLLFGYDWVVIGGAKPFYEPFFRITENPVLQGWAVSCALIGCIIGALSSGQLADKFGRKTPLILSAILFLVSAFGSGIANQLQPFIIYRLIGGIGIGIASTISPMYIAEVAPARYRGRFVSFNQLTLVIGILLAQVVNFCIADSVDSAFTPVEILESWNGQEGWRWMFWAELIPAFLFLILMFTIPESPRFQTKKNPKKAFLTLKKIGGSSYASKILEDIKKSLPSEMESNSETSKRLLPKNLWSILIIGIVLAVFQQWCGINIIFNYADEVFSAAGYTIGDILFNIVLTGSVNLIFTIVAMKFVDSIGRRKLLLFGSLGLAFVYILLGLSYFLNFHGWPVLVLIVLAIAIYAMSLAPVTWIVISEIFPNRVRGKAMSISIFSLWAASFLLAFTFPVINESLGAYGVFWLYSFICFLGYFFIYKKLPETKGKSLEELELELTKNMK